MGRQNELDKGFTIAAVRAYYQLDGGALPTLKYAMRPRCLKRVHKLCRKRYGRVIGRSYYHSPNGVICDLCRKSERKLKESEHESASRRQTIH